MKELSTPSKLFEIEWRRLVLAKCKIVCNKYNLTCGKITFFFLSLKWGKFSWWIKEKGKKSEKENRKSFAHLFMLKIKLFNFFLLSFLQNTIFLFLICTIKTSELIKANLQIISSPFSRLKSWKFSWNFSNNLSIVGIGMLECWLGAAENNGVENCPINYITDFLSFILKLAWIFHSSAEFFNGVFRLGSLCLIAIFQSLWYFVARYWIERRDFEKGGNNGELRTKNTLA